MTSELKFPHLPVPNELRSLFLPRAIELRLPHLPGASELLHISHLLFQLLQPTLATVGGGPHRVLSVGLEWPGLRALQQRPVVNVPCWDHARPGMDPQTVFV